MSDYSNSEIPNGLYYADVAVLAKIFAKRYGTSVDAAYEWFTKDVKVPSADVQPVVHGEWIDYTEDGYVECPYCHSATNCDGNKDELHFCFSCGADMRG